MHTNFAGKLSKFHYCLRFSWQVIKPLLACFIKHLSLARIPIKFQLHLISTRDLVTLLKAFIKISKRNFIPPYHNGTKNNGGTQGINKKIKYFCVALPNGEVKFTQKKKISYLIEQPGRKDNLSCIVEYKETPEIKGRPVLHVAWPDHLYQQNITHAHEEGWPW